MYLFTRNKSRIEAMEEDNKSESDESEAKSVEHPGSEVPELYNVPQNAHFTHCTICSTVFYRMYTVSEH